VAAADLVSAHVIARSPWPKTPCVERRIHPPRRCLGVGSGTRPRRRISALGAAKARKLSAGNVADAGHKNRSLPWIALDRLTTEVRTSSLRQQKGSTGCAPRAGELRKTGAARARVSILRRSLRLKAAIFACQRRRVIALRLLSINDGQAMNAKAASHPAQKRPNHSARPCPWRAVGCGCRALRAAGRRSNSTCANDCERMGTMAAQAPAAAHISRARLSSSRRHARKFVHVCSRAALFEPSRRAPGVKALDHRRIVRAPHIVSA